MLGERLKTLRKSKNLTQIEFAKIFKISNGTIAMWETNKRQPDQETLVKIANYFGVTIDYLLGRTDLPIDISKKELEGYYFVPEDQCGTPISAIDGLDQLDPDDVDLLRNIVKNMIKNKNKK